MPLVVALSSKATVSSTSSNNQATRICNLLSNQGSDATLLGISTQMHLWLTENCSGKPREKKRENQESKGRRGRLKEEEKGAPPQGCDGPDPLPCLLQASVPPSLVRLFQSLVLEPQILLCSSKIQKS